MCKKKWLETKLWHKIYMGTYFNYKIGGVTVAIWPTLRTTYQRMGNPKELLKATMTQK